MSMDELNFVPPRKLSYLERACPYREGIFLMHRHINMPHALRQLALHLAARRYHGYFVSARSKLVRQVDDVTFHAAYIKFWEDFDNGHTNVTLRSCEIIYAEQLMYDHEKYCQQAVF